MLFNGRFVFCHFLMLFNGNSRIEKLGGSAYGRTAYGQTLDGWTDGRTNGQMDRQMDEHKEIHSCPTGRWPFKAAAQKVFQQDTDASYGQRFLIPNCLS